MRFINLIFIGIITFTLSFGAFASKHSSYIQPINVPTAKQIENAQKQAGKTTKKGLKQVGKTSKHIHPKIK